MNIDQKITGRLFVISAYSGAGKNTLVNAVIAQFSTAQLARVVTYTTKKPGTNEKEGQDYFFVSPEEFQQKIEAGFFFGVE